MMRNPERVLGILPRTAFLVMALAAGVLVLVAPSVTAEAVAGKVSNTPPPHVSNAVTATIPTDVISGGGGASTSASYKISDTFGQGPIGPLAVGTTVKLQDGFWATISAKGTPPDTTPPAKVVTLEAVAGEDQVFLRWTNPSDADFAGTLIIYSVHEYPSDPTDGTPVPNDSGGVFHNDPATADSFPHTGLIDSRIHYYSAFAFDQSGNYAKGKLANATPVDTTPPSSVASFTAAAGDTTVTLHWTNPADLDFKYALVRYSTTSLPADPTQGTPVKPPEGKFFNDPGTEDGYVHTRLQNGATYYYSIWAFDEVANHSLAGSASAAPEDTTAPGYVAEFTATAGDRSVTLDWKNPPDLDVTEVRLRYSTTAAPTSPTAGSPVKEENDGKFPASPNALGSFVHTGLLAETTYYYSIFTFDEAGNNRGYTEANAEPFDLAPPGLAVSVFQNPYVTKHLDIYLIASEPVQDASVSVKVNDAAITMQENDTLKYVYRGDYDVTCAGTLSIDYCAADLAGHDSCSQRAFTCSAVFAASGGTAHSMDGMFEIGFPSRAVTNDAYVLISESEVSGSRVYEASPQAIQIGGFVEISIAYDAAAGDPEHLSIARLDGDRATPLDSYLDRERGRVLAYAEKLGRYRLLWRQDAVTPAYGAGTFRIVGNVPNPFVASTSIEFDVVRAGKIEVEIVSVDGRHVRTLGANFVPPGRRSLVWDGCDDYGRRVACGMYVCRAISGQDKVTHKMVYLR